MEEKQKGAYILVEERLWTNIYIKGNYSINSYLWTTVNQRNWRGDLFLLWLCVCQTALRPSGENQCSYYCILQGKGFLGGSVVKNPPAKQEMRVWPLDQEDPLKEMATHSSILAWEIPWTEEPGGLQSMGLQRVGRDLVTKQQQFSRDLYKKWPNLSAFWQSCS